MMIRKCHYCNLDWNVSRLDPGSKKYVCPVCERKRRVQGVLLPELRRRAEF